MSSKRKTDNKLIEEFNEKNYMIADLCQKFASTNNADKRKELAVEIKKLEDEVKFLQIKIHRKTYRSVRHMHFYTEKVNEKVS